MRPRSSRPGSATAPTFSAARRDRTRIGASIGWREETERRSPRIIPAGWQAAERRAARPRQPSRPKRTRSSCLARSRIRRRLRGSVRPARLMYRFSIDIAAWNGRALRRVLASAERLSDRAIRRGSSQVNTPGVRSSASLRLVTSCDHRRGGLVRARRPPAPARRVEWRRAINQLYHALVAAGNPGRQYSLPPPVE